MLPAILVGGLGCSAPFAILIAVALSCLFLSTIIGAEDVPTSCQNGRARRIRSTSFHSTENTAFVHHNKPIKTQLSFYPLMVGKDIPIISLEIQKELNQFPGILGSDPNPNSNSNPNKPGISKHYACPPTSLESLRKRYGTRQSLWGEWSNSETRSFYRTQLPRALQIDGALGLTLEVCMEKEWEK